MKLCSISLTDLKKKTIILSNNEIPSISVLKISENNEIQKKESIIEVSDQLKEEKKINSKINIKNTPISGLSISSLKAKKEIENFKKSQTDLTKNSKISSDDFNIEQLIVSWDNFYKKLLKNGEKNLASILLIDVPVIKNKNEIHYTLTNNTNKVELEKVKNRLVKFLKIELKNTNIELVINVDKIKEKKFLYTPSEKYEKLKSINPVIEKFRKDFKLNL